MNIQNNQVQAVQPVPLFHIGKYDSIRYRLSGARYSWVHTTTTHYTFREARDAGLQINVSKEEFYEDLKSGSVEVDRDFYLNIVPPGDEVEDLGSFEPKDQVRALFYKDFFDAFLRRKAADPRHISTSDRSLKLLIPLIWSGIRDKWPEGSTRPGPDSKKGLHAPSPRHFRRLLKRYVKSGYRASSLVYQYAGSSTWKSSASYEEQEVYHAFSLKFAHPSKPTKAAVYRALRAHIFQLNKSRMENGEFPLHTPGRKSFEKRIDSLDPFAVCFAREGADAARQKFGITSTGLDVERPGERIEMDGWKVDLMVWLISLGVYQKLSPKERAAVSRARLWVTVAIDVRPAASWRCVSVTGL